MGAIMQAALYAFGGSAWTFFLLNVQERFFWPDANSLSMARAHSPLLRPLARDTIGYFNTATGA